MAKMKKGACKLVRLGDGRGTRHLCYIKNKKGVWRPTFVSDSKYRRLKGLSGVTSKNRRTTKKGKR